MSYYLGCVDGSLAASDSVDASIEKVLRPLQRDRNGDEPRDD